MNLLNKMFAVMTLLVLSIFLSSCSSEESDDQGQTQKTEDVEKAYKAKVSKRMGKVTYKAAMKELGAVGVSESQVKCVLKDRSYVSLSLKKDTPEVKAVFEDCGVDMQQLKAWYD